MKDVNRTIVVDSSGSMKSDNRQYVPTSESEFQDGSLRNCLANSKVLRKRSDFRDAGFLIDAKVKEHSSEVAISVCHVQE
jgi:hypothetical protein